MQPAILNCSLPLFVWALAAGAPAAAQFLDLATDSHGSRLLFSTPLSLPGDERNDQLKIIEASPGGSLRTLFSTPPTMQSPDDSFPSNFPVLRGALLSSSGALAYTASRWCIGGSRCLPVESFLGTVLPPGCNAGQGCAISSAGTVSLSSNGRWAVFFNPSSMMRRYWITWLDLETGATASSSVPLAVPAPAGGRIVASDGAVVSGAQEAFLDLRRPASEPTLIPTRSGLDQVIVSSDGRFAVGVTRDAARSLTAVDFRSGLETVIVEAEEGCSNPVLSEDGSTLLFLSGANWEARNGSLAVQVWTIGMLTGRLMQWTSEPEGIAAATLSGDGQTVWAATGDGRILRLQAPGAAAEEVVAASPDAALHGTTRIVPGSRYTLEGSGLAGVHLHWQGLDLPVIESSNHRAVFLVPWEAATGKGAIEVEREHSPFAPLHIAAEAAAAAPLFAETEHFAWGLHADGTPLTLASPAMPGETIKLMITGLGPVSASGQAQTPFELRAIENPAFPPPLLPILGAALDPGAPGMYWIQVRLPAAISTNPLQLAIRTAGADHDDDWVWLPVALP
jgi:uncharacterized protein (TIGR03437 family)